jgi:hypothetical protein
VSASQPPAPLGLHCGEWVVVRSEQEILATLDADGRLNGMPFMPEMLHFCGRRFRVFKRAHKTCDTVLKTGGRRLQQAVHLEGVRCDGAAHDGCQAGCLIFWKEAWLKRVSDDATPPASTPASVPALSSTSCTRERLIVATRGDASPDAASAVYTCQATRLLEATTRLPWWDVRQYLEDYSSGNVALPRMLASVSFSLYNMLIHLGIGIGPPLRWFYDRFQSIVGGVPYPHRTGRVPAGESTPTCSLGLKPGDWVRVREYPAILTTLDGSNRNRGLRFDCEAVPYCGGVYKVVARVDRIIDEQSGRMLHFKNPSVTLDGVFCRARYSRHRLFCPRSIYPMWRDIWLEQVSEPQATGERAET